MELFSRSWGFNRHAAEIELAGVDKSKIIELKLDGNKDAELYKILLIAQCNELHRAMPFLFERVGDETEMLLPDNLLASDSVIRKMTAAIDEADWAEVEIIGWLYQFYISERKDEVIGKTVKSEDIPAATQLFTPNWIVKYMTQNSLGRLWLESNPQSSLASQMEFYIKPAETIHEIHEKTLNKTEENSLRDLSVISGQKKSIHETYEMTLNKTEEENKNSFSDFSVIGGQNSSHEKNMQWIAEQLGAKANETPIETIRRYFSTAFFKDHLQTYKKRPIYWLFSSGKQKAFECLVYLHRYNEATLPRMRHEYVLPLMSKLTAQIELAETAVEKVESTSEKTKLARQREILTKKQTELAAFDEKLRHYSDLRISLDLDDGVKVNYGKFGDLLAEVKQVAATKE